MWQKSTRAVTKAWTRSVRSLGDYGTTFVDRVTLCSVLGNSLMLNVAMLRLQLVMVALWNRADHYILMLWFLSSFFPRLISAAAHWMSTILPHMVWP